MLINDHFEGSENSRMKAQVVVIDIGKTMSKLTVWARSGKLSARRTRANPAGGSPCSLDLDGIDQWLFETLAEVAAKWPVDAIIPVGHGAAAVVVRNGAAVAPPVDYECPISAEDRRAYGAMRDPFALTGSPALPDGLNLGAQLHCLSHDLLEGASILLWPQYWAWRLSGVMASEVTSLGTHTDLWRPIEGRPSALAVARGWADRLPPVRRAGDVLGPITAQVAAQTGLDPATKVHVGLHDSNAALLAARAFPEIGESEATVLSTGTWFVAMRAPAPGTIIDIAALPEARDCLVNVDAFGQPIPSARFMGGREIETLIGIDTRRIDILPDQPAIVAALPRVIASGAMVLPNFAGGFGPFPNSRGRWVAMPADPIELRAAVSLYAALVADVSLDLIGAHGAILVEGRFAEAELFVRALATLRPDTIIYAANAHNDVSFGALRLLEPDLAPDSELRRIEPLEIDLSAYRTTWRNLAERMDRAA
ncbi:MAG: carbohydrate kinase [Sphingomicrobium sp.]